VNMGTSATANLRENRIEAGAHKRLGKLSRPTLDACAEYVQGGSKK